jgi:hypothetical protein
LRRYNVVGMFDTGQAARVLELPSKVRRCKLKPAETRVESALLS